MEEREKLMKNKKERINVNKERLKKHKDNKRRGQKIMKNKHE